MKPLDATVLAHLRPGRRPLLVVVAAGIAGGLLTVAQAFALGALVVAAVSEPGGSAWQRPAIALLALVSVRVLASYVGERAAAKAAGQVSSALRDRLLGAARAGGRATDDTGTVVLATRGVASVEPYVTRYLPALVPAVVLPVVTIVAIWWLDWLSGLIVLLTLPLVPVFAALIGMTTRERADRQWRLMGALSGHFLDVVQGLPTLVAHSRAEAQVGTIRTVTQRYRRATVDTLKVAFASSSVLELIATLSVALVAVSVGLRLASGSVGFQIALTVLLLAPEAYWPLRRVGAEFHSAAEGTAALAEADALLASVDAAPGPATAPARSDVRLAGLEVGYPSGPSLVESIDLQLPERGLVAVTGPSGCGKSTLLATLRGELPPLAGQVLVGGVDLADVDAGWWRRQVAWAPQRPWLRADSIADNVRLGRPSATDDEVRRVLRRVGLDKAVDALPHGIETPLGEDGAGLSAGQRARVALARVIISERPVVLLDEPSAHLDDDTERVLLDTLNELARTSLVIAVAHRPAVVAAAERELGMLPRSVAARTSTPAPATIPTPRSTTVVAQDDLVEPSPRWGLRTASLIGALSVGSGVALTATAGWLITRASEQPPVLYLMVAIVGVRLFGLARPVLRHTERILSHDVVLRDLAERRAMVFADLVPLVPGRLGPRRGDLLTRVVDDVDAVLDGQLRVRQPLMTSLLVGAGATLLTGMLDLRAGLVVLAVMAVGPLVFWLDRHRGQQVEPFVVGHRSSLATRVEETVHGLSDLEQWQAADIALADIRSESDALTDATRRSVDAVARGHALAALAAGLGVVAMAALVPAGAVSPALLALLLLTPLALADAISPLADAGALSVRTRAADERLAALAATTPAVTDPVEAGPDPVGHAIDLERVTVGWDERPALRDLDLRVRPGEHLGVTGPSGSGKSTLAATLMRFLDPVEGRMLVGGVDGRALRLDQVRGIVGLVDDDPHVLASTVVENVRFARPDATDEDVVAVLARVRLDQWVAGLPRGIHTTVGAGSRTVSGGERARIGLARALLADSAVVVLDEPTAQLDAGTAREVTDDLLGSAGAAGRSVVWITHGTVGLDAMDRVVGLTVPEQGEPGSTRLRKSATAG